MRRPVGLLLVTIALAAAGCGEDGAQGPSAGDAEFAGQQTRDAGSVGEQVSAEDVSELEKLREQVSMQCDSGKAPDLDATVKSAVAVAAQTDRNGIVDLSQIDRAPNIETYLNDLAGLLDRCGAAAQADELRAAEYGTRLER